MSDTQPPRPYVDPTMVDGTGIVRPTEAPQAWQQASKQPRRRARPAPRPVAATEGNYIARHWRGELSLARSYWLNNMLLATPLALLLTGLMSWISVKGDSLQISAIVTLLGVPLLMGLDVWCIVGAWRAAGNYLRDEGAALWGWLARVTLALGALQFGASVLFGFMPNVGNYWQMARGIDPIGQATLSLSADGRSLRVAGTIGMGDGERVRKLLASAEASQLKRVELESPGGRVREAERMAEALQQHRHASRAVGTCASACTLVFMAGQPRQLTPGARLGFHRASTGTFNPVFEELANQNLAASYRKLGLPESLIDKTLATPARSMWFPKERDLQGLVAPLPQTLDIELPLAGSSGLADFQDALRTHPVWDALERRQGGTIETAAQRMWAARSAGLADAEVQAAALSPLAQQMPQLIAGADAGLRRRYVQLVTDQLKALRTPAERNGRPGCRDLLDGRLAARPTLPMPLQVRESQWLLDAAQSPPPRWLPRPPNAIETEVLARSMGASALGALAQLWRDTPATAATPNASCEPVIALLDRVQSQPPARRELAERLLFHGAH